LAQKLEEGILSYGVSDISEPIMKSKQVLQLSQKF